jgi:hypothetical protein
VDAEVRTEAGADHGDESDARERSRHSAPARGGVRDVFFTAHVTQTLPQPELFPVMTR